MEAKELEHQELEEAKALEEAKMALARARAKAKVGSASNVTAQTILLPNARFAKSELQLGAQRDCRKVRGSSPSGPPRDSGTDGTLCRPERGASGGFNLQARATPAPQCSKEHSTACMGQAPNVLQTLFGGPMQLSCINPVRKSYESKNPFGSLRRLEDDENEGDDDKMEVPKLIVNLADAVKGRSQNQMRKERAKLLKSKRVRFMETPGCNCCSDTIFGHFPDTFCSDTTFGHFPDTFFGVDGVIDIRPDEAAAETPGCNLIETELVLKHSIGTHLLGNDGRLGSFPAPPKSVEQSIEIACEHESFDIGKHSFPELSCESSNIAKSTSDDERAKKSTESSKAKISKVMVKIPEGTTNPRPSDELLDFAKRQCGPNAGKSLNIFNKVMRSGSLMPIIQSPELQTRLGKFEILIAVIDSGATVAVMNPSTGASYKIEEGSANGTEYEIASGDTLEDLGEKRMAVVTAEGIMRGYISRCAEVTKSLQSVRALVNANHAVCFGLGDGHDHLIINKVTGEINRMRDDGVNYLQDLIIVPPDHVDAVAQQLDMIQQHAVVGIDSGGSNEADFHWQGE